MLKHNPPLINPTPTQYASPQPIPPTSQYMLPQQPQQFFQQQQNVPQYTLPQQMNAPMQYAFSPQFMQPQGFLTQQDPNNYNE